MSKLHKSKELVRSKHIRAGKIILKPSEETGEHIPYRREEVIIILKGNGLIIIEGKKKRVKAGDVVFVAQDKKHNIINDSRKGLVYVYVVAVFTHHLSFKERHYNKHHSQEKQSHKHGGN